VRHVVPGGRLFRKALFESCCLVGDVEAVEIVEKDERVALAGDQVLPLGGGICHRAWLNRFDKDQPRPVAAPVEACQHIGFRPLDIDLEEVDPVDPRLVDQPRQPAHRHLRRGIADTERARARSVGLDRRREAVQLVDGVELDLAVLAAGQSRRYGRAGGCAGRRLVSFACGSTTRPRQPIR
jgi:hypothetical protein